VKHQVEGEVLQLCFMAQRILQKLEMRYAVLADGDEFSVNYGIAFDSFERLRDFDIAVADDLPLRL
jgi:hypothetical protein